MLRLGTAPNPCAPILGIALVQLRKIIKRISADNIFCDDNSKGFKIIAACCLIIAVITLIAGRFYLPFYIVSGTFIFLALVSYTMRAVFLTLSERYGEKHTKKEQPNS